MSSFSDHDKRFARRCALVRRYRKLSQDALAVRAGISRNAVNQIERNARGVRLGEAARIVEALDVPLAAMVAAEPLVLTEHVRID